MHHVYKLAQLPSRNIGKGINVLLFRDAKRKTFLYHEYQGAVGMYTRYGQHICILSWALYDYVAFDFKIATFNRNDDKNVNVPLEFF